MPLGQEIKLGLMDSYSQTKICMCADRQSGLTYWIRVPQSLKDRKKLLSAIQQEQHRYWAQPVLTELWLQYFNNHCISHRLRPLLDSMGTVSRWMYALLQQVIRLSHTDFFWLLVSNTDLLCLLNESYLRGEAESQTQPNKHVPGAALNHGLTLQVSKKYKRHPANLTLWVIMEQGNIVYGVSGVTQLTHHLFTSPESTQGAQTLKSPSCLRNRAKGMHRA